MHLIWSLAICSASHCIYHY